jgi:hypothetical protein
VGGAEHLQVEIKIDPAKTLGLPVAYNAKKIEKHVKLLMLDDLNLLKMLKKEKESKHPK